MDVMARLDWSAARTVSTQPANMVLVQGVGEELILSFGHAVPPIALAGMTTEQMNEHLKDHPVAVQQISRFTLPIGTARTLLKGLREAVGTHDAATKSTSTPTGADAEATS